MKKLSINIPEGLGDVLSQEELKHVLGGMGSYGSLGSDAEDYGWELHAGHVSEKIRVCYGKRQCAPCSWTYRGRTYSGTCQNWFGTSHCSDLNCHAFRPY